MGKSKKAKKRFNDARGYGQQNIVVVAAASSSSKATGVVSKETHDNIQSLVDNLSSAANGDAGNASTTTTTNIVIDARFVSKFSSIVDKLLELGFTDDQLDILAENLPPQNWSLEQALDWLCLNTATLDLPPLFTDGNLRDSLREEQKCGSNGDNPSNDNGLTVLKFIAKEHHRQDLPLPEEDSMDPKTEEESKSEQERKEQEAQAVQEAKEQQRREQEAKEAEEQKRKILQQYAEYYSDGEEEEEEGVVVAESATDAVATETSQPEQKPVALSATQLELQQKELELKELEADLGNEANNYMRSKHETKILQNQAKQLRKHVAGLKRKVEKETRQKEQEEMQSAMANATISDDQVNDEEEDDYGGGDLFGGSGGGLFDTNDGANDDEAVAEPIVVEERKPLIDAVVPKGWTGTTPQKTLEEVCKKKKRGRPRYTKLPARAGYKLSLSNPQNKGNKEFLAKEVEFVRGSSLQDYLALQALYDMDPTLPMYRMFPPALRDAWLSWAKEVTDEQNAIKNEEAAAKSNRIDRLLAIIKEKNVDGTTNVRNDPSSKTSVEKLSEVQEDWEDLVEDEDDNTSGPYQAKPTNLGSKLEREFIDRQGTSEYRRMLSQRENLPVMAYRDQFLEAVRKHPVVILQADTGAGKTTQCPQFILEEALLKGKGDTVNVVCTQPRRVAATSVAERVSEEMNTALGDQVGYQIRMESKRSRNTRLLFCTTGVLIRRLQDDSRLQHVTHLVIDEVHERQVQTDVLLIAVKQILSKRRDLKVILMSATMDSELFSVFFHGAPVINVPGRTFPVASYHLEDLLEATGHVIEQNSQYAVREYDQREKKTLWVTTRGGEQRREVVDYQGSEQVEVSDLYEGYSRATRLSMDRVEETVLNYDLVEDVLQLLLLQPDRNTSLIAPDGADVTSGAVLVFLPGLGEIRTLSDRLTSNRRFGDPSRFCIIPLHSKLSSADQRKAFLPPKPGVQKIVLATNIAETSVTISDVVAVIDCGRERELRRNRRTSTAILVTDWCSKASVKQRQGRAGRVQPGLCLKLFSSRKAESMKAVSEPELKRVPLEEVCLSILASSMGKNCQEFLQQAPQPPEASSIQAALDILEEVGAIKNDGGTTLTSLGRHLARLPVDVHLGKMLVMGSLFPCLDRVLTVAATLSSKSPFATSLHDGTDAKAKHKQFQDPDSDFVTLCNVFEKYAAATAKSNRDGRAFCQTNYLNQGAMRDIRSLRYDFLNLLCDAGFVSKEARSSFNSPVWMKSPINQNNNDWTIVHAVVCAGLWPNVAKLRELKPGSFSLWNKNQEIFFHRSSVNASKERFTRDQEFVCYFERFGTAKRESITTTCFVDSIPLLLFGGDFEVKHIERRVIINDWLDVSMSAQVGVLLQRLRQQIDELLQKMVETIKGSAETKTTIDNIVAILSSRG